MDDLTEFVRARLDEDEAVAKACADLESAAWRPVDENVRSHDGGGSDVVVALERETADHIARHDPARALREVTAKRDILNAHISAATADRLPHPGATVYLDGYTSATEVALKALAAVYSDHPDYRPEWTP